MGEIESASIVVPGNERISKLDVPPKKHIFILKLADAKSEK